jgi:hypothetical protein
MTTGPDVRRGLAFGDGDLLDCADADADAEAWADADAGADPGSFWPVLSEADIPVVLLPGDPPIPQTTAAPPSTTTAINAVIVQNFARLLRGAAGSKSSSTLGIRPVCAAEPA